MKSRKEASEPQAENPYDLDRLAQNWGQWMRLTGDFARIAAARMEKTAADGIPTDPFNLMGAWNAMLDRILAQPDKLTSAQIQYWRDLMALWDNALTRMTGGKAQAEIIPDEPGDRRFRSEAWHKDALFGFIRQSYLLTARWMMQMVEQNSAGLEPAAAKKLQFFTRAFIDALSPTNFAFTNPDVLEATIAEGGENLVRGMKNLLEDMKRGSMRMTDEKAFTLGENIATTPGQVVFRNRMMELIHYAPAGDTTFETPLLIIPPWINKYYILDLRPDNSLVKWALEQGHAVFMISWVNPDASLRDVSFEDYMHDGVLAALDAIEKQTHDARGVGGAAARKTNDTKSTNVIGYCIGGTLLAMTLSWLKAKGNPARVKSATFLTTLLDFENAGDLKLFVDEEQLAMLHQRMEKLGFLDAEALKATFSLLRANDLIWSFVINNYLMGREPFPFDLLYWNSDSTNLPAAMHEFYLRHMYLNNDLKKPGGIEIGGVKMNMNAITTPAHFISTREDHIAPWKATFAGSQLFSGDVTFTLSASGHIAGIVNAPAAGKYCYWTSDAHAGSPEAWLEGAQQHSGSWWPHWQKWVERYAGKRVPAIDPARGPLKALAPAPGSYVRRKAST